MNCQEAKLFVRVCSTYHIGEALGNMLYIYTSFETKFIKI
jgi:hypothetical protein